MGIEELDRMPKRTREKYIEIIRGMSSGKKLEITLDFCDGVRELVADNIRHFNPGISDSELRDEMVRRTLPEKIRKRVYGW